LSKTVIGMCLMLILHQGISSLYNIGIGIGYQTRIINSRIHVSTKSTQKNHTKISHVQEVKHMYMPLE
jgi:hypothetical protein